MCHNPGTWQDYSLVSLNSEESCQWTNCKTKYKLQNQNLLGNNCASLTWERLCQFHLGTVCRSHLRTIVPSLTWEQLSQPHLEIIVPDTPGNIRASLTWEKSCRLTWGQLCQSHFATFVPVSLENNCTSLTWERFCQSQLGTIMPVSLGNNRTSLTW